MNKKEALNSILAVFLGLIAGALLILLIGKNPVDGYVYLFKGSFMSTTRIGNTLAIATPLIFTGLSVAFAFKTGLFNIGAPGQMLAGGFVSIAIGLTYGDKLSRPVLLCAIILGGAIAGGAWAFVPGVLKAKFNVNEVVSAIMMNWIAYWIVYYKIPEKFKGSNETESAHIVANASLQNDLLKNMFDGSYINLGIIIAIIVVLLITFILNKTTLGYELKAVGFNKDAAEYAGMSVNKNIILSMMIAGALAGLAGVTQYTGNSTNMQIGIMPSQGFDGIAVSLLGVNNPFGAFVSAIFFGILYAGKGFMSSNTGIPPEIADTIISVIIYFAAISAAVPMVVNKFKKMKANKAGDTGVGILPSESQDDKEEK